MASYMDQFVEGAKMAVPQTVRDIYGGYQNIRKRGLVGGVKDAGSVLKDVGGKILYGSEGAQPTEAPAPAVKPVTSTPSAYMQNLIQQGAGTVGINKMIDTQADKTVAANNRPAIGSQVPPYMQKMNAPAPVAPVDPQQARIKAYQDFMAGSKQRGDEALARWNDPSQQARYGFKAYSSNPKAREEQAMARENRAAQNAQANVAGEREAGVERFKAEKAAEGMVGAKELSTETALEIQREKNAGMTEAATIKGGQVKEKNDIEILKALAQSEDDATKSYALNQLKKLGGVPESQDAQALEWAKKNPKDPRSAAILAKNGIKA